MNCHAQLLLVLFFEIEFYSWPGWPRPCGTPPHSAEFQDDRHELPPLMRFQSYTASELLTISWRLKQFQNASI